jgi:hypothetical protein
MRRDDWEIPGNQSPCILARNGLMEKKAGKQDLALIEHMRRRGAWGGGLASWAALPVDRIGHTHTQH